jgi:nucleoid DNA-binding protein
MRKQYIVKSQMASTIAKEAGITIKAANVVINLMWDFINQAVGEHRSFIIPNVGTVKSYIRPAGEYMIPGTRQKVWCEEKHMVKIRSYYRPNKNNKKGKV